MNELNKMHKVNKKYSAEAIESREKYVRVKYSSGKAGTKRTLEEANTESDSAVEDKKSRPNKLMISNSADQKEDNAV